MFRKIKLQGGQNGRSPQSGSFRPPTFHSQTEDLAWEKAQAGSINSEKYAVANHIPDIFVT